LLINMPVIDRKQQRFWGNLLTYANSVSSSRSRLQKSKISACDDVETRKPYSMQIANSMTKLDRDLQCMLNRENHAERTQSKASKSAVAKQRILNMIKASADTSWRQTQRKWHLYRAWLFFSFFRLSNTGKNLIKGHQQPVSELERSTWSNDKQQWRYLWVSPYGCGLRNGRRPYWCSLFPTETHVTNVNDGNRCTVLYSSTDGRGTSQRSTVFSLWTATSSDPITHIPSLHDAEHDMSKWKLLKRPLWQTTSCDSWKWKYPISLGDWHTDLHSKL
jgi:hypothetical protein